jgi:hypothetical protein
LEIMRKAWKKIAVGAVALGSFTAVASATPPSFGAIDLPFDLTSLVTALTTLGATVIIAVSSFVIMMKLGWKLPRRIGRSI